MLPLCVTRAVDASSVWMIESTVLYGTRSGSQISVSSFTCVDLAKKCRMVTLPCSAGSQLSRSSVHQVRSHTLSRRRPSAGLTDSTLTKRICRSTSVPAREKSLERSLLGGTAFS